MKKQTKPKVHRETLVGASPPKSIDQRFYEPPTVYSDEDLELLNDPDFMSGLEQSEQEIANGKTKKWKGFKAL